MASSYYTSAFSRDGGPREDPNFEQIVNELRDIQTKVDVLVFGSVFLRRPMGLPTEGFGKIER